MMEKELLRKADIFSGALIVLLGLFILFQGLKMPMKDSWGGVQNVWFVSPALFPLFVGSMLAFLGVILIVIAVKSIGLEGVQEIFGFLLGPAMCKYLGEVKTIKFYAIVLNLVVFVFLMIPRIDFFPAAIQFLLVFFFMFYLDDERALSKIFKFTIITTVILGLFLLTGIEAHVSAIVQFSGDYLVFAIIGAICFLAGTLINGQAEQRRKYRLCLLVAFAAPVIIGIIFKYFLLVPMPFEGLVIQLLDAIWYAEFWS